MLSRPLFVVAVVAMLAAAISLQAAEKGGTKMPAALNFKMQVLDGKEVDLSQYQGKVVLVVNVASKCGFTPQYEQLQALHERYGPKGLPASLLRQWTEALTPLKDNERTFIEQIAEKSGPIFPKHA